jgi:hypothetical protein
LGGDPAARGLCWARGVGLGSRDLTATASTSWNGSFVAPVFTAELVAPVNPADFVCDTLP